MATVRFQVVRDQGDWIVKYCDKRIGPFDTQEHAISAAIESAQESGCLSHESQVMVEGEDGQFRIVWTYGQDSCPPEG